MAFLTLENICKYYTSGQSVVMGLSNINLSFSLGEFVAVTGESGSGKSTLAKVIAGILSYEGGEMSLNGRPTSHYGQPDWENYRCRRVSFISQNYDILPGCTVLENVVCALMLIGIGRGEAVQRAEEILERVELLDKKNRRAAKLSSGQKQRLSIARALAKPAPILVADEPTGNLDVENSAKVIELLATAAKERLVIMVTHDFREAERAVTRKITIRDGVIDSDVILSPDRVGTSEDIAGTELLLLKGKNRNLSCHTGWLQVRSRPVWSVIMLLFSLLTAISIIAFLGTFVVNLDDSFTRKYDDSAFYNGDDTRIAVARNDGKDMTEEDRDILLGLEYVDSIERYGFLPDINYYYRRDVDYNIHYIAETDSFGVSNGIVREELTLGNPTLYLQTIPCLPERKQFLKAGRLPENMYEAVAAGDESLIGTEIPVYISNRRLWPIGSYIMFNVEIVGVTDFGSHLYFDGQLGRALTGECRDPDTMVFMPYYENEDSLKGRFICSEALYNSIMDRVIKKTRLNGAGNAQKAVEKAQELIYEEEFIYPNHKDPDEPVVLKYYGIDPESSYKYYMAVDPGDFERVTEDTCGNVISMTISDYAYTDRVLGAVSKLGYIAVSPYRLGTTRQDETLAGERLRTLKICILASLAVFVLQILVLRAMFGMETEEYRLLANLGLRCRTAKQSIVLQAAGFTAGGQLLALPTIIICRFTGIERFNNILKYLPPLYILLFLLIHMAMGLLASLWVQASIGRQVFRLSQQDTDLKMDEEAES